MAAVRITTDIRTFVYRRIDAMFQLRIQKKLAELQNIDIANQVIYNAVSEKHVRIVEQLNQEIEWVEKTSTITVILEYTGKDGRPRSYAFVVGVPPPLPLPKKFHRHSGPHPIPSTLPCYALAAQIRLEHDDIVDECDALKAALGKVLNQCGTLAQVLKVWPSALDYMPEEVRTRHGVRTAKREKTKIDNVAVEAQALLLKARLLHNHQN